MASVRGEITKTLLRLSRLVDSRPGGEAARKPSPGAKLVFAGGTAFGPYVIDHQVGSGGMGQVFLATDSRLRRKVALKFLSPELVTDRESLRRLEAEARMASALNHPNILTIYEIGELDDKHYIASEYIDGQTLRSAINKRTIDPQAAIDVICQVLSALSAAHTAGVVHRDLKPGNIMIRPDGYAKVIDFGLAKQTSRASTDQSAMDSLTRPGLVVGTVYYMSPEQACGDTVDHRTDIWSAGIILFEIIARRRPFEGESESRVVRNICSKPLPEIPKSETLPAGLQAVIERALQKDPDDRYQSAQEMLDELSMVGLGGKSRSVPFSRHREPPRTHTFLWLAGALVALLIASGLWLSLRPAGWLYGRWMKLEPQRQLTFGGSTQVARISPDGKYLAYVTGGDESGSQSLYLRQVDSAAEELKIPPRNVQYRGLTFAPDSQTLMVVEKDRSKLGKLFAVPLMGSKSTVPLITDIDGPVSFSPDGIRMAFVRYASVRTGNRARSEGAVYVAARNGSDVRQVFSTATVNLFRRVIWSPKGEELAVFGTMADSDVLLLSDLSGHVRQLRLANWRRIGQPVWSTDGRKIVTTAATGIESDLETQIREIDVQSGEQRDVTHDLQGYRELSASGDGALVAAIRQESKARIWLSDANNFQRGTILGAENERYPSLSWFDADHLVVNSRRNRFSNLWLLDVVTQTRTSLTDEPFSEQSAVAIPGARSLIFVSNRAGGYHLWKFDSQSNEYVQLTTGASYDELPAITPDGQWVFYNSWQGNSPQLRKVRTGGGDSIRVGDFPAQNARLSPDGRWITCLVQDPATLTWQVAVTDVEGAAKPRLIPSARLPLRWSPDGKSLSSVMVDSKGVSNIWTVPLNGGKLKQVTQFDDGIISGFEWSPAGDRLAVTRVNLGTDAVLFRNQSSR